MLRRWGPVIAGALLMLLVGLWGIRRPPLWLDEAVTYHAGHLSFGRLGHTLLHVDAVHGTYYTGMNVLFSLVGGRVLTLRVPSVIALAVVAGLVVHLARRLGSGSSSSRPLDGVAVALTAALLFAASPFVSYNAQNGRSYALVCLAVTLATLQLCRIIGGPGHDALESRRQWFVYGLLMTVAVYLHELCALAFLAHGATLLLARISRATRLRWLLTSVLSSVAALPVVILSLGQTDQLPLRTGTVALRTLRLWQKYTSTNTIVAYAFAACIVTSALWVPLARRTRPDGATLWSVALPMLVVPSVVMSVIAAAAPRYYSTQYLFYVMPAVVLLAADGAIRLAGLLDAWRRKHRSSGRSIAIIAIPAVFVVLVAWAQVPAQQRLRSPSGRITDLTSAAHFVGAHHQHGDGVVFVPATYRSTRLAYVADFRGTADVAIAQSPQRAANLRGTYRSPAGIRDALLARSRVWLVGRPSGIEATKYRVASAVQKQVLYDCFRIERQRWWYGVQVALWVRQEAQNASGDRRGATATSGCR